MAYGNFILTSSKCYSNEGFSFFDLHNSLDSTITVTAQDFDVAHASNRSGNIVITVRHASENSTY